MTVSLEMQSILLVAAIVITRMAHAPETRAHVAKRTADGNSRGEIRRCLKRFVARRMYALLEPGPAGRERPDHSGSRGESDCAADSSEVLREQAAGGPTPATSHAAS